MDKVETLLAALAGRVGEVIGDTADHGAFEAALEPLVGEVRDAVSAEVGQLTHMDPATSVNNRGALEVLAQTEFGRALRYHRALSAVSLEVDGFSGIRENSGEDGADAFLRTMILDCCRGIRACDIVGRTGGAVFTILLPETGLDGAVHVGQRLRQIMRETPIPLGEDALSYTVTVGVATADLEDSGGQPLLDRAADALRQARKHGEDRIIVARQTSLELDEAADDPESDFNKALGSVSVEYISPEEMG